MPHKAILLPQETYHILLMALYELDKELYNWLQFFCSGKRKWLYARGGGIFHSLILQISVAFICNILAGTYAEWDSILLESLPEKLETS